MATRSEYGSVEVAAAYSVLIELMQILGDYRDQMVLIGGWVPFFLFGAGHTGSTDIDLALDRELITDDVYRTIRKHLQLRGYEEGDQPYTFRRRVMIEEQEIEVDVDFLAGEYGGSGRSHRTQRVQDIRARKARGCELALRYYTRLKVDGTMPDGTANSIEVQLSEVVPFIVMKGMALYNRMKEKDAWDIYFCLRHYPDGIEKLAEEVRKLLPNSLVEEGLAKIRSKFNTVNAIGPGFVVAFEALDDPDEIQQLRRDAFERITMLLDKLDIPEYQP